MMIIATKCATNGPFLLYEDDKITIDSLHVFTSCYQCTLLISLSIDWPNKIRLKWVFCNNFLVTCIALSGLEHIYWAYFQHLIRCQYTYATHLDGNKTIIIVLKRSS